jgi:hypothetical protein
MRGIFHRQFDCLEVKKLLSAAHVASAVVDTPLMLTGTLDVELKQASTIQNIDGSETTTVPVEGRLGTLGKITGEWSHSLDYFGNYEGPDRLVLNAKGSKGAFTISFDDNNVGTTSRSIGHGISYFQHSQKITGGSGSFARVSEHGSIELLLNTDKDTYQSISLITVPTAPATT